MAFSGPRFALGRKRISFGGRTGAAPVETPVPISAAPALSIDPTTSQAAITPADTGAVSGVTRAFTATGPLGSIGSVTDGFSTGDVEGLWQIFETTNAPSYSERVTPSNQFLHFVRITGWSAVPGLSTGDVIVTIPDAPATGGEPRTKYQYSLDGGATYTDLPAPAAGAISDSGPRTINLSDGQKTIIVRPVSALGAGQPSSPISVVPKVSESMAEFVMGPTIAEVYEDFNLEFGEEKIRFFSLPTVRFPVVIFGVEKITVEG